MDHYDEAERLLQAGLLTAAIAHALLALVDVLRDSEDEDGEVFGMNPAVLAEFLRPIKDAEIKDGLL